MICQSMGNYFNSKEKIDLSRGIIDYSGECISLDNLDIEKLIDQVSLTKKKRIRICLHSPSDLIHEMIPMHDYQFGLYEEARAEERKTESKRPKVGLDGALQETTSTYRIFSRAYCNFVFPPEIPRPKPREGDKIKDILETKGCAYSKTFINSMHSFE